DDGGNVVIERYFSFGSRLLRIRYGRVGTRKRARNTECYQPKTGEGKPRPEYGIHRTSRTYSSSQRRLSILDAVGWLELTRSMTGILSLRRIRRAAPQLAQG